MEGNGTVDFHETELVRLERLKSQITAAQMAHLARLDEMQVATADGSRNMSEWVAARLDVSISTARSVVRTMRRTEDRPDLREALASGEASFDRIEALSMIPEDVGLMLHADVAGVHREGAKRARLSIEEETRTAGDNFMVLQPTLDETWFKFWGGLDGYSGALVDKVLSDAADQLPDVPDGSRGDLGWRRATALVGLCQGDDPPPAQITVFIDTEQATASNGEAGVMIEAGPKAGRQALEAILCDAFTELTVNTEEGVPLSYGRRSRTVPPALRRAVIHAAAGVCATDGCNSRYRIEAHHMVPWSQGGTTDPENLVALCWFHHHVVIADSRCESVCSSLCDCTTSGHTPSTGIPTTGESGSKDPHRTDLPRGSRGPPPRIRQLIPTRPRLAIQRAPSERSGLGAAAYHGVSWMTVH